MKKFLAPLFAAVAVAAFATGAARADTVWTYDWTPTTTSITSDNGNYTLNVSAYKGTFTGPQSFIAANFQFSPVVSGFSGMDTFNKTLVLTGTLNGNQTVTFDIGFHEVINGSPYVPYTAPTITPVSTGTGGYAVTVNSVTPAGSFTPNSGYGVGSILVTVVPPSGNSGTPNGSPEPSTMLLSCVGLAFGGFATWRKRKQAIAA